MENIEYCRRWLAYMNLTQVARATGLALGTVIAFADGSRTPTARTVDRVLAFLDDLAEGRYDRVR